MLTVKELKAELQSRGLSMSGGKKELVFRLQASYRLKARDRSRVDPLAALIGAWFMLANLVNWCVGRSL